MAVHCSDGQRAPGAHRARHDGLQEGADRIGRRHECSRSRRLRRNSARQSREESRSHRLRRSAWAFAWPTTAATRCSSKSTSKPTSPRATRASPRSCAACATSHSRSARAMSRRCSPVASMRNGKRWCRASARTSRCDVSRCSKRRVEKSRVTCTPTTAKPRWSRWSVATTNCGATSRCTSPRANRWSSTGADVAPDVVEKEREIYTAQAQDSGKPADIIAKMVEGRVRKFLAEVSLLEQPFVKDPNTRVSQLLRAEESALHRIRPVRSRRRHRQSRNRLCSGSRGASQR